jgi:BMFP domain-containing protein YqiC
VLPIFQSAGSAQSLGQLSAQISRLESENTVLRSRLSQLESQVSRIGRAAGVQIPAPNAEAPSLTSPLASDPTFSRLATLVIELRERIVALENRLSELTPPTSSSRRRAR